ncbi:unnamed protein product, partial [Caretta caretta]
MSCPTRSLPAAFLLVSILGLQEAQFWITFPFCIMYVIAVLGNVIVFCIIKTESSLQELMHLFLAMLAITDLVLSTSTLPKKLSIFWLGSREIAFYACLTQMFFVHSISLVDSGMLLALALYCYMSICCPLQHSSILSVPAIVTRGSLVLARGVLLVSPFSLLVRRLPFCQRCLISHSYCEHMAVVKLRCGDATVSAIYGLFVAFMLVRFDVLIISVSCATILKAVLRLLPSQGLQHLHISLVCRPGVLQPWPLHLPHPPLWPQCSPPCPHPGGQSLWVPPNAKPCCVWGEKQTDPGEGAPSLPAERNL